MISATRRRRPGFGESCQDRGQRTPVQNAEALGGAGEGDVEIGRAAGPLATMSRIPSPRGALTAARRAASPPSSTGAPEDLVGEVEQSTPAGMELAAPTHVLRGCGSGDVKRACRRRPPIKQQRLVVAVLVENADPADVQTFVRNAVQPTETQPAVRHVQPVHLFGQRAHVGIPCHECPAILEVDGAPQRRAVPTLHTRALGVEPRV
jgi:hypothetical protein